ncbi:unnamed protein product [Strongylus vulgaris]|uniref:Uncharacterized protein n=1 Tax=Strongylus vulgaris TaxID=40348 RepID=A0A3P7KV08_STRVU|nr:unnamed protein product [Strongylus vulgaris]
MLAKVTRTNYCGAADPIYLTINFAGKINKVWLLQMKNIVGLANLTSGYNSEQNSYVNNNTYVDPVVAVCRELLNKEKEMSPSRRSSAYARLVIEKLFRNRAIDLCAIMPPTNDQQLAQHPFHLVHEIINSKSSFFETILEADDGLSNELWQEIRQQADSSIEVRTKE